MKNIVMILYSLVAIAGLYMLVQRSMKKNVNIVFGILHGFVGLIGIALLIIMASYKQSVVPVEAILVLFTAFLIGGGIFSAKVFANKFNIWAAVSHAIVAAVGLYLLFAALG